MILQKSSQAVSKNRVDTSYSRFSVQCTTTVAIDLIESSLQEIRRYFNPQKLDQLIKSIKEHGILEPVLVRPLHDGRYQLVAGERRIRAARAVGLVEIPVVMLEIDDKQALQIAIIENLQREELNPVEETEAILELLSLSLGIDANEVISLLYHSFNAKQRGKSLNQNVLIQIKKIESLLSQLGKFNISSFRASRLPLLKLPDDILSVLRRGEIEYTKAQAIARLKLEQQRTELLNIAILENLSLSEIKARVKVLISESQPQLKHNLTQRFKGINKLLRHKDSLINTSTREKITKLLDELEQLISKS
ncbi:MAG: ParB/RepB/Spo0J family partition protein [Scytonema sp. PMC 1069.18]|nr:ParB/RepB/Spo0J family partition protein [Scytonema sp. PMC 1069.18]MEC4881962.1 ParB/RepB/Spo0J family partition protein [Scytonema sp. PMC 1070.18]